MAARRTGGLARVHRKDAILAIVVTAISLMVVELALRWFVEPSAYAAGVFLNKELPPYKLIHEADGRIGHAPDSPIPGRFYAGVQLTNGDLRGIFRTDALLGYAPRENARSRAGWWETNSIGARAAADTSPTVPANQKRLLVFGESFAQGSRVKQGEAWPERLNQMNPELDVVNFAVDGYSMAQAYLRYTVVKESLDHDIVALMFVPSPDLWRDVNIRRDLGGEWWGTFVSMPRFALNDGQLTLIQPPSAAMLDDTPADLARQRSALISHLSQHDRLFRRSLVETNAILDSSVGLKLIRLLVHIRSKQAYRESLFWDLDSEAQTVSRAIFAQMSTEVLDSGRAFFLVPTPTYHDVVRMQSDAEFRLQFRRIVDAACSGRIRCLNIWEQVSGNPIASLDLADDHYGPATNLRIAELLNKELTASKLVSE